MREITLHPGESLIIDGLTIKCTHKPATRHELDVATLCSTQEHAIQRGRYIYDPETGQHAHSDAGVKWDPATKSFVPYPEQSQAPREPSSDPALDPESIALLRASVANWVASGDLSQTCLLRSATREAADVMSVLLSAEQSPCGTASDHPEHPQEHGKPQ